MQLISFFRDTLQRSVKQTKNPLLMLIVTLDVLFIMVFGFIASFILAKIQERAIFIIGAAGQQTAELVPQAVSNPLLGLLRDNPSTNQHVQIIIYLVLAFMLLTYLLYSLLQGLSWRLTFKLRNKPFSIKKFFVVNIFWFSIFYVFQIADFFTLLTASLQHGFEEAVRLTSGSPFFIGSYTIITYFALLSYPLLTTSTIRHAIKKAFILGTKKIQYILPTYLIIAVFFFIADWLLSISFSVRILWIIIGALSMALIAWARIFLTDVVERIT